MVHQRRVETRTYVPGTYIPFRVFSLYLHRATQPIQQSMYICTYYHPVVFCCSYSGTKAKREGGALGVDTLFEHVPPSAILRQIACTTSLYILPSTRTTFFLSIVPSTGENLVQHVWKQSTYISSIVFIHTGTLMQMLLFTDLLFYGLT